MAILELTYECLGYDFEFRGIVWQAVSEIRFYNDTAVSFETKFRNRFHRSVRSTARAGMPGMDTRFHYTKFPV